MATDTTVYLNEAPLNAGAMPRGAVIPSGIIEAGLLSNTSKAIDCFAHQKFSAKLQVFMIGYVSSIMSYYSVYK